MNKIKIDPEFRDYMPQVEGDDLERLLLRDGCRDKLIVWKGKNILVDGHRRYAICEKHGLGYGTVEKEFADRDAVLNFIDELACARRNLSADELSLRRGRIYNRLKKATNDGGKGVEKGTVDHFDPRLSTAETLAEKHHVSAPTIKRDGQFARAVDAVKDVDPDIEKKIAKGEAPAKSTIVKAAKATTKKEKKAILEGREPETKEAPEPAPKFPAKVQAAFETVAAFKGMLQLCTQLTAGIGKVCGDAKDTPPAKGGELLAASRQEALAHIKNLRNLLTAYMPHAVCPYCKAEGAKCSACKGLGWVAKQTYEQAPKDKQSETLVASTTAR